jgi:TPR repeat protein
MMTTRKPISSMPGANGPARLIALVLSLALPLAWGVSLPAQARNDAQSGPGGTSNLRMGMAKFDFRHENYISAYVLFQRAMKNPDGTGEAAYWVGYIRERGLVGARDIPGALMAYHQAAEEGWMPAAVRMARIYLEGRGVERDYEAARHWLEIAADANDAEAQAELGRVYQHGWGVKPQPALAYAWYELAAQQGEKSAIGSRDHLRRTLNPDQLAEAKAVLKSIAKGVRSAQK